jgi:transposase
MRTGRPLSTLILKDEDRSALEGYVWAQTTSRPLAVRARIVLACAEGKPNKEVSQEVGVTQQTVSKWRSRFRRDGLNGLLDELRPGRPRQVDKALEDVIVRGTRYLPPGQDTAHESSRNDLRWTTRSLAKETGLSASTISRVWRRRFRGHLPNPKENGS